MSRRNKDLTSGNIKSQLFKLSWPMLFGMVGMVIFNLVDTYFVGKLGVEQLAEEVRILDRDVEEVALPGHAVVDACRGVEVTAVVHLVIFAI